MPRKHACLAWPWLIIIVAIGILAACHRKPRTTTPAKPTAEARAAFSEGVALYDEGRYEESEAAFTRAYNETPSYKILYNIGQAQAMAGKNALAAQTLRRYLREGGDEVTDDRRIEVESDIRDLDGGEPRKSKKDLSRGILPVTALPPAETQDEPRAPLPSEDAGVTATEDQDEPRRAPGSNAVRPPTRSP